MLMELVRSSSSRHIIPWLLLSHHAPPSSGWWRGGCGCGCGHGGVGVGVTAKVTSATSRFSPQSPILRSVDVLSNRGVRGVSWRDDCWLVKTGEKQYTPNQTVRSLLRMPIGWEMGGCCGDRKLYMPTPLCTCVSLCFG